MREYIGAAFNHVIAIDGGSGQFKPQVELIVMSSTPKWSADVSGLHPTREVGEHRIFIGSKGLRQLAEVLVAQADILERIATENPNLIFRAVIPEETI